MFTKLFAAVLICMGVAMAAVEVKVEVPVESKVVSTATTDVCQKLLASNASAEELQRSGCCSWHGGVCGCSNGRAKCCDGTLSPSCGCD